MAESRTKRDSKLILLAKERDKNKCILSETHITFLANNKNYTEGHHIIPIYQQKNYNFPLDDVNNIISLCPNCHREAHFADKKDDILQQLFIKNQHYIESKNISLNDLQKMY